MGWVMKAELKEILTECSRQLTDIESKISETEPFDKTRAYLTQYALIKACGTLEYVFRSIVADFFDKSNLTQIQTYLDKTVRSGSMSAKYENMLDLLGKFDKGWRDNFKNAVNGRDDGQRLIESAKSLVTNRHLFAHGKSPTATFNDIHQYYHDALNLIYELDKVVK